MNSKILSFLLPCHYSAIDDIAFPDNGVGEEDEALTRPCSFTIGSKKGQLILFKVIRS